MSGTGNEEIASSDSEQIRKRIAVISEVSALPLTLQKIISALRKEALTIQSLEEVIRHDQSLASKIISVANSAFYYMHRGVHVNSLDQAILVLGVNAVRNIAMGISIFKIFSLPYKTLKQMWAHSYRVALASGFLASRLEQSDREIAFLAGLLHDIGRVVLFSLGDKGAINGFHNISGPDIIRKEREIFHCSHMEAGYWFLKGISLPDEVILPVLHHHDYAGRSEHAFIVAPVSIAEGLVSKLSDDESTDGEWSEATVALAAEFGFDQSALSECMQMLDMEDEFITAFFES
jgi:putative nucleotidyltransferase with HDIG domain